MTRKRISMSQKEEVTFKEGFEIFIADRKAKNLSNDSIEYYKACYRSFTTFFEEDRPCNEIDKRTITDYKLHLQERDIKDVTVNKYLRGLRAMLYFFMDEKYIEEFPIQLIKEDKTVKETYTDTELALLLRKPDPGTCSFSEYRNWVIVCFAYGTAARSATIRNIKICDIDFYNEEIRYTKTKSRKQYIVPLSSSLAQIIQEYLPYRKGKDDDYLFCSIYGEQFTKDKLTNTIHHYNKSRGVEKTSLHLFRHTFAKHWILNGGDIFRLQKILGHSTLDMVKQYVNMFGSDLKNGFDEISPLENMQDKIKTRSNIKMKR